jgi:peptide/nickel transport system substrate-binding protein
MIQRPNQTARNRCRRAAIFVAIVAATTALAACDPSHRADRGAGPSSVADAAGGYNGASASVVNPSTHSGGIVKYELPDAPDSFDPGNTYSGYVWDFSRLYARALTTYDTKPGAAGLNLVPDLATSLGKQSDDGKTWTYTLRPGVKYQDGTEVTSVDVKYAIERSNYAPDVISNGPNYFNANLVDNPTPYAGPYKDPTGNLASIQTPDKYTIVFNLKAPFADFDYLVSNPQTSPVRRDTDTGIDYVKHIQSTGPYMFASYHDGKSAVLVRNPNWSPTTDPLRRQYADEIDVKMNLGQQAVDHDVLNGRITADLSGAGIAVVNQPTVLSDPSKKASADEALSGLLTYMAINVTLKPLDNIDCRQAIEYAVNKTSVQAVVGGPVRGQIATTVLPPNIVGYSKFDSYPTPTSSGDTAKAKAALTRCGHAGGFDIGLAARSDLPGEVAAATAIKAALDKIGITVDIQLYPMDKYYSDFAGAPLFAAAHNIGLTMSLWSADWPTGYGFLEQIVDGRVINPSGNTNLSQLDDHAINDALADAITETDAAARARKWGDIDKMVMADAAIVPLTYRLNLLYRPPAATNVYVQPAYGMYDYLTVGTNNR